MMFEQRFGVAGPWETRYSGVCRNFCEQQTPVKPPFLSFPRFKVQGLGLKCLLLGSC